jgi:hypothetical protein
MNPDPQRQKFRSSVVPFDNIVTRQKSIPSPRQWSKTVRNKRSNYAVLVPYVAWTYNGGRNYFFKRQTMAKEASAPLILTTKLHRPPLTPDPVFRPRLIERLNQSWQQ